jgi:hypothetical protein
MYDPPYALWSIWRELSFLQRLFVLTLGAVVVYSVRTSIMVLIRLRSLGNLTSNGDGASAERSMATLYIFCENLQQVSVATFYFFGAVLFVGLQTIGRTLGDGPASAGTLVLANFILDCAFAANVFFLFLLLHLVQWFVRHRLNSYSKRLNARH